MCIRDREKPVLGGFDRKDYTSKRIFATSHDGEKVPIMLVYKTALFKESTCPCLLYAYGAYGYSTDAWFSTARLSLLNRGFVFAVANVRGGDEMGRQWYKDGAKLKKMNTFLDFIACSKHLVDEGIAAKGKLHAYGASAGGLLIGAVVNMAGSLYHGAIADVPYVDAVTTMLDDTIPLTTGEYDEWGNPNDKIYYDYIKSYSPYDNVDGNKTYPNMLVLTGLNDSQVQYWEPAKWVAKLRAEVPEFSKSNGKIKLYLHTDMDVGHGGPSGRFKPLREVALKYAFLLNLEGITK
eukprot:TRINITY_DN5866_c0_g1_i1.p2 TRINITY_DN5866_c0_g1~~TRINITY_DN5866_c0_g1_i1.p2  ORF type:complete len:293 (-),score=42.76 TRINITY_DN5866_c0_g1_i1:1161-2039(-)